VGNSSGRRCARHRFANQTRPNSNLPPKPSLTLVGILADSAGSLMTIKARFIITDALYDSECWIVKVPAGPAGRFRDRVRETLFHFSEFAQTSLKMLLEQLKKILFFFEGREAQEGVKTRSRIVKIHFRCLHPPQIRSPYGSH